MSDNSLCSIHFIETFYNVALCYFRDFICGLTMAAKKKFCLVKVNFSCQLKWKKISKQKKVYFVKYKKKRKERCSHLKFENFHVTVKLLDIARRLEHLFFVRHFFVVDVEYKYKKSIN